MRFAKIQQVYKELCSCLEEVSRKEDVIVVQNYLNPMSLDLLCHGCVPKPYYVNFSTQKEGVLGGYVVVNRSSTVSIRKIPIVLEINNRKYYVTCDNDFIEYSLPLPQEKNLVFGMVTDQGQYYTSDLDLLLISSKSNSSKKTMSYTFGMGDIMEYEYLVAQSINEEFTKRVKKINPGNKGSINIVQHGPFNRYSLNKTEDIHFPLTIFHPLYGKTKLGTEENREHSMRLFLNLTEQYKNQGYTLELHPSWRKETISK